MIKEKATDVVPVAEILKVGSNVEITGLDAGGSFQGVLYAQIDDVIVSDQAVVMKCTDTYGCKHEIMAQRSSEGEELSNLVQAWGTNTPVTRVYGPVPRARVSIWKRRSNK